MAKKVLKNRTQITSTLKNELNNKLKELSSETDVPISKLLDQAVELLIEHKGVKRDINIRNQAEQEDKFYVDIHLDNK